MTLSRVVWGRVGMSHIHVFVIVSLALVAGIGLEKFKTSAVEKADDSVSSNAIVAIFGYEYGRDNVEWGRYNNISAGCLITSARLNTAENIPVNGRTVKEGVVLALRRDREEFADKGLIASLNNDGEAKERFIRIEKQVSGLSDEEIDALLAP
jgi:hypothetical protein